MIAGMLYDYISLAGLPRFCGRGALGGAVDLCLFSCACRLQAFVCPISFFYARGLSPWDASVPEQ